MLSDRLYNTARHFEVLKQLHDNGAELKLVEPVISQIIAVMDQSAADAALLERANIPLAMQIPTHAPHDNVIKFPEIQKEEDPDDDLAS